MYIVTSKPKRISVYSGLVHTFVLLLGLTQGEFSAPGANAPTGESPDRG